MATINGTAAANRLTGSSGDDLVDALGEVLAYQRGEPVALVTHQVHVPETVDVRAIRAVSSQPQALRRPLRPGRARRPRVGAGPPPPGPDHPGYAEDDRAAPRGRRGRPGRLIAHEPP